MSDQKTSDRQLSFTERQASILVSTVIFSCFLAFLAGYFVGKKSALESFTHSFEKEILADGIVASIYNTHAGRVDECSIPSEQIVSDAGSTVQPIAPIIEQIHETTIQNQKHYYAQLVGFSTKHSAYTCASRLQNQGFAVTVKERKSKTNKGRLISWYQVITQDYADRQDLEDVVEILKKQEKLKDVAIVTV